MRLNTSITAVAAPHPFVSNTLVVVPSGAVTVVVGPITSEPNVMIRPGGSVCDTRRHRVIGIAPVELVRVPTRHVPPQIRPGHHPA